ncbi:hypothetical protein [Arenivirga flava]|uniref:Uncharacterized protein n=1 Tax=Arenivirga flava TaxID=1930060 RepID=A0AA37UB24_9MICO|nr:hypothetical protein [Arenivirga flava]GMA27393.1 hypothetical protein GCM10025874_06460 [Arenivirga flava]
MLQHRAFTAAGIVMELLGFVALLAAVYGVAHPLAQGVLAAMAFLLWIVGALLIVHGRRRGSDGQPVRVRVRAQRRR